MSSISATQFANSFRKRSIDPVPFYATQGKGISEWSIRLKRLRRAGAQSTKVDMAIPLPEDLTRRRKVWKLFYTQSDAFAFAESSWAPVKVFAFEEEGLEKGKRRFLATTYNTFWERYLQLSVGDRHFYEVIKDGSPCKLYLDLEYLRADAGKPVLSDSDLALRVIEFFQQHIKDKLGEQSDGSWVIQLDSSTDGKFSRHLIFPRVIFANNIIMGHFMRSVVPESVPNAQSSSNNHPLFIPGTSDAHILIVDLGVYTKNRNFRLYLSSKIAKGVPLMPVHDGTDGTKNTKEKRNLFMDSLICNVNLTPVDIVSWDAPTIALAKSGLGSSKDFIPCTAETESTKTNDGGRPSPYPAIDDFIIEVASVGEIRARIRRWTLFTEGKVLLYDIEGNRWCWNIGRQHKSNGVMYVVNLMDGLFYQKCYDSECRAARYRSDPCSLPDDLCPFVVDKDDDADDDFAQWSSRASAQLDEIELRAATEGVGQQHAARSDSDSFADLDDTVLTQIESLESSLLKTSDGSSESYDDSDFTAWAQSASSVLDNFERDV